MFSGGRLRQEVTSLSARENFIEFCHRENFKTFIKVSSKYNGPFSLALASLTTDAHSVLSKAPVPYSSSMIYRYPSILF
jgi:hypothetical protein